MLLEKENVLFHKALPALSCHRKPRHGHEPRGCRCFRAAVEAMGANWRTSVRRRINPSGGPDVPLNNSDVSEPPHRPICDTDGPFRSSLRGRRGLFLLRQLLPSHLYPIKGSILSITPPRWEYNFMVCALQEKAKTHSGLEIPPRQFLRTRL